MTDSLDIRIPRPVQVVLDDVGWREGWNLSAQGGPFRAGVDRLLGEADYHAVADWGARLGIRPQCAMILCEWDRENVCAQYPTTTPAGAQWDNSARLGDWAFRARDVFVHRAANIEFALHGVGHEHWENGVMTRAEWCGRDGQRWPWEVLQGHLECYRRLLAQYGLDPASGISFPRSFVPGAFAYYWDNADPESTGALMKAAGVRHACLTFQGFCTFAGGPPERPDGGFDHGMLVLDRDNTIPWHAYASVPATMPATSVCGLHWPNLLMPEADRNGESVDLWASYLGRVAAQEDLLLAANTAEASSQWVYRHYASLTRPLGQWVLDATALPPQALAYAEGPILKIPLPPGAHVSRVVSSACRPAAYWEREGYGFLRLAFDHARPAAFEIELGPELLPLVVLRDGTFDVLDLKDTPSHPSPNAGCGLPPRARPPASAVQVCVRMYGSQTLSLLLPFTPGAVTAEGTGMVVQRWSFDSATRLATIALAARDIQGQVGTITVR